MHTPSHLPPWLFILDGTFLGFIEHELAQVKYLTLDIDEEAMTIEVPKNLWQSIFHWLQPGDRIRCIGHSQLDFASKQLHLSAYQVLSLMEGATLSAHQ